MFLLFRQPFQPAARLTLVVAVSGLILGCRSQTDTLDRAARASEGDKRTAAEVLERMAATYREAKTYRDQAAYHETFTAKQTGVMQTPPPHRVAVTFERPGKFRMERIVPSQAKESTDIGKAPAFSVIAASDGTNLRATISGLPDQLLEKSLPEKLSKTQLAPDPLLDANLIPVPLENLYPQLDLLLSTEDSPPRLFDNEKAQLLSSKPIDGQPCYRVQLEQSDGKRVLWISQETYQLKRVEAPTEAARAQLDPDNVLSDLKLWIEFSGTEFDGTIPPEEFVVETPAGAKVVEAFVLPEDKDKQATEANNAAQEGSQSKSEQSPRK